MEVVYRLEGATAAQIAQNLPDPPSYSAVRAMLTILEDKGHLRHQTRAGRYLYLPTVPAEKARRRALRDIVSTFFQGSSKQAVVALLDQAGGEMSGEDLQELRRLVDRAIDEGGDR